MKGISLVGDSVDSHDVLEDISKVVEKEGSIAIITSKSKL